MAATIDDVLKAIATMQGQISKLATKEEVNARFDSLDERVELVRGILENTRRGVIGDLRDDVTAIHRELMKAKPHDVPKDLPSQVRAKGERPSKPAKRTARRR